MVRFKRGRVTHIGFIVSLCSASGTDNLGIAGQLAQYPCIRYVTYLGFIARHDSHSLSSQPDCRKLATLVVDPVQLFLKYLQLFRSVHREPFINFFIEPLNPL